MSLVSAAYALKCDATEQLDSAPGANSPQITHNKYSSSGTLTPTSTVPGTKVVANRYALVAGAKTLDLTALVGTNGVTVDGTGLKLQILKLKNVGANRMTFAQGGSNAYQVGGANFTIPLEPNQEVLLFGADLNPDVSGTVKNIAVTGTGTQEFEVVLVMG